MKTSTVGIVSAAVLMVVTGIGFGIAQAGGADWSVEALDSYFENQPENRPVLSFEDQETAQVAKSPSENMQLESPIETGSLPSERHENFSLIEIGGSHYRVEVDIGP